MKFTIAAGTDTGSRKSVNQDSFLCKTAHTSLGDVCMALICDGIGGLEHGEVASQVTVSLFSQWFTNELKDLGNSGFVESKLEKSIENVFIKANRKLIEYGIMNNVRIGTTASLIIFIEKKFYIYHIGDTRIYKYSNKLAQLTEDHTLVASKIKNGQITLEEAKFSKEKHILLQSVGVNDLLEIHKVKGTYKSKDLFLLCCDGQYNKLEQSDLIKFLDRQKNADEESMESDINYLIDTVKRRGETDNITTLIIRTE